MSNQFDTSNAPTTEPTEIVAGNFARWRRTDLATDYPPAEYQLDYIARGEGDIAGKLIELTATEDSGDFLVQVGSVDSNKYFAGIYHWSAFIERLSDNERIQIERGTWTVKPNPVDDSTDPASFAKRMLNKIEDAIEGRANNYQLDTLAYSMQAETSATRDPAVLLKWRTHFKREVRSINRRANAKKGRRPSNYIQVGFK